MRTRNGVYYNLELSGYRHTIDNITFVFSSQLHKDKFKKKLTENRNKINVSLSKRFNISVDVPHLADIVLYRKIETRGFLVITADGKKINNMAKLLYCAGRVRANG